MIKELHDVLGGTEGNYLLPFYWQHGDHYEKIPEQVKRIYDSGARALCVESRPHLDFCGEGWWRDMDLILSEAQKYGMKVWILDDNHFPTGNANGLVKAKYPEKRKWQLIEYHVDVIGPMKGASLLIFPSDDENVLLSVYAYKRSGVGEELEGEAIYLTGNVADGFLHFDIPEGIWRVFSFYKSRKGVLPGEEYYIDMLSPESVDVLIEAVYEPHYKHYSSLFGNTIAGFFSDEPSLGNDWFARTDKNLGMYNCRVGMPGLALPWKDEIIEMMENTLGRPVGGELASLWYDYGEGTGEIRFAYMDAVTKLYRDSFNYRLGNWCRERGVEYIGHIIEDMNAHARLSRSGGHFYRSLEGQDMSGMDIVLHQIIPGLSGMLHSAICFGGYTDPEFFDYVLAKLCSSAAHINPLAKGRAMCEVFGAYGWAEGTPMMKWLMDFLIVRGVNYFVPHAFSPCFPDPDCPPHFGAEGLDPQFEGFGELMRYTNKMSHLFAGALHHADAAILYHAEGEWMNADGDYMLTQKPAKLLYDAHIDYDIIPFDALADAKVSDGKLLIADESYKYFIIPYSKRLPDPYIRRLSELASLGVTVICADGAPSGLSGAEIVPLGELTSRLEASVKYEKHPLLRHSFYSRGSAKLFMFFNESVTERAELTALLPCGDTEDYLKLDLLTGTVLRGRSDKGKIEISLEPYESCVYVFDKYSDEELSSVRPEPKTSRETPLSNLTYDISLSEYTKHGKFTPYERTSKLFNLNSADRLPGFSGKIKYSTALAASDIGDIAPGERVIIELGEVGQTASLITNGKDAGVRIAKPYSFDITDYIVDGRAELEITVSNTLANAVRDRFSHYLQIPPTGLIGPVKLIKQK